LLRELLTYSSEGKSEDGYLRFAESRRWIAEMTGSRDRGLRGQEGGRDAGGRVVEVTTTSRGECSGLGEVRVVMSS
jgi:hypothetical protein